MGFSNYNPSLWGFDNWDDFGHYEPKPEKKEEPKCECGSDAIKALRHSDWCPKYRRPDEKK